MDNSEIELVRTIKKKLRDEYEAAGRTKKFFMLAQEVYHGFRTAFPLLDALIVVFLPSLLLALVLDYLGTTSLYVWIPLVVGMVVIGLRRGNTNLKLAHKFLDIRDMKED